MGREKYEIRLIKQSELGELLNLYKYLNPDDPEIDTNKITSLWEDICKDKNLIYLAVVIDNQLVSSCVLTIIPNLTRNARPYGLIENVVTHPNFRRKGYGSSVLKEALSVAWMRNCYKVMLLTGSKKPETLRFYENTGFKMGIKTGFIATP
ncbi:GNAT family N-acetyltransferase [Sporolactobacillus laevolacticus]|uniref:GNAT family N-acetyltransferase n=1 Tax=Sporolactobacillus laevolacticus TaxID=33018 RepID=UPI0025B59760|nr:GNAT family N-acetyltransferase [Sporolactobacillus laevolacticus]MDN3956013.1 GNAT family N-acetyltransferase [Sporolactobacillus laevolacticus]